VRGHFVAGPVANYILVTADAETLRVAYHEYVHVAIHRVLASVPLWFDEGLAEFYSTFEMTFDNRVRLGSVLPEHVLQLRERGLMPLATLTAIDPDSALYNEGDKSSVFYAQSWLFVHYLLLGQHGKFAGQLAAFAGQLIDGASLQEACARALNSTPERLEEELRSYASQDSFLRQLVPLSTALTPLSGVSSSVVSEADVHATLGDILLNMSRPDAATAELNAALAADGHSPAAHASLGRLLMDQGRNDEARAHLERAVASPAATWLTYFSYGTVLMGSRSQPSSDQAAATEVIEGAFRRAIELNSAAAAPYGQLAALLSQDGGRLREARDLVQRALALTPTDERFILIDAVIHINASEYAAGRGLLIRLTKARDPGVRKEATDLVAEVDRRLAETAGRTAEEAGLRLRDGSSGSREHIPLFRRLLPGEQRAAGWLTALQCSAKGVAFQGRAGSRAVRLHARRITDVVLVNHSDVQLSVRCGQKFADTVAVFTYTGSSERPDLVTGAATVVEFPPADYVPADVVPVKPSDPP
jgi:tetratricopeptide (TPR) repeat protein